MTDLKAMSWNKWWSNISTGANDKHMQCAFEAGFDAADKAGYERGMREAAGVARTHVTNAAYWDGGFDDHAADNIAVAILAKLETVDE